MMNIFKDKELVDFLAYIENGHGKLDDFMILTMNKFLCRKINSIEQSLPLIIYDIDFDKQNLFTKKLEDIYGKEFDFITFDGKNYEKHTSLNELGNAKFIFIKETGITNQRKLGFSALLEIVRRLRDKDGCPWDKEQTHASIRGCLIEEAYELVEAIDLNSKEKMLEESGDVLLQAIFHAIIAEESGEFSVNDMISELNLKLYNRHTHIFGQNKAENAGDALKFWDLAKNKEKSYDSVIDKVNNIPISFSALLRADKTQRIIKKTGFDYKNVDDAIKHLYDEIDEFMEASEDKKEDEAGDVLFSVVNILRINGINPEIALNKTTEKFKRRFEFVEKMANEQGVPLNECTIEQMEEWYQMYKRTYENR